MEIEIPAGKYVLAVSGGVDSVVLLDLLSKQSGCELIVAHFNHGIRPDAAKDEELVANRAKRLSLPFEAGYGHLGDRASEEQARDARYKFLNQVKQKHNAKAIITAHHQDDLIETAVLNLLRGTGRKGLAAISANKDVLRPFLGYPKRDIMKYAKANKLKWREDTTNSDDFYLRNYVRNNLLCNLTAGQKKELICNIDKVAKIEHELEQLFAKLSHNIYRNSVIDRGAFTNLPIELGNELVVYWLRGLGRLEFDRKTINRLNMALRTSRAGTSHAVKDDLNIKVGQKTARFAHT